MRRLVLAAPERGRGGAGDGRSSRQGPTSAPETKEAACIVRWPGGFHRAGNGIAAMYLIAAQGAIPGSVRRFCAVQCSCRLLMEERIPTGWIAGTRADRGDCAPAGGH